MAVNLDHAHLSLGKMLFKHLLRLFRQRRPVEGIFVCICSPETQHDQQQRKNNLFHIHFI